HNGISRQFKNANFDRGKLDDLWLIKRGKKITDTHSAVFPEELVKTIIENFSNEGDLIYDPFMGTGTTAIVAKKLNRNYLGSELTEKYFKTIQERLCVANNELF
ncbi:MAG TPA: site-specific DNA-methyltransferase, partial [Paludibacteraceae bacterium]|nr:site-specific DNA-methyltransferase [Paludibacteraceae bacterium]